MPPAIQPATPADAAALVMLWRRLIDEHRTLEPRFVLADDAEIRWRNDVQAFLLSSAHRYLLATEEDRSVGFIHAHRWQPAPLYGDALEVFVAELYLLPEYRRLGLGRRLIEEIRIWAESQGAHRLRLGVLAANVEGVAFWESIGARALSIDFTIDLDPPPAREQKRRPMGFFPGT